MLNCACVYLFVFILHFIVLSVFCVSCSVYFILFICRFLVYCISCMSFSLTFLCLSLWASLHILLSLSISLSLYPSIPLSLYPSSLSLSFSIPLFPRSHNSSFYFFFLFPIYLILISLSKPSLSLLLYHALSPPHFFELLNYTFFFPACSSDFFSFPKKAFYIILLPVFPTFFVGLISYQSTVHILYLVCLSCVSVYHSHSHSFFPLSFIFRETFSSFKVPVCSFSLRYYNGFLLAFFCLSERRICKHTQWLLLLLGILYMYCCSNIMKF